MEEERRSLRRREPCGQGVNVPPRPPRSLPCGPPSHWLAIMSSYLPCKQTCVLSQVSRACKQATLLPGAWHTLTTLPPRELVLTHQSLKLARQLRLRPAPALKLVEDSLGLFYALRDLTLETKPPALARSEVVALVHLMAKLPATLTALRLGDALLRLDITQARSLAFPKALREVSLGLSCWPSCWASVLGKSLGKLSELRRADLSLHLASQQGVQDLLTDLSGLPRLSGLMLFFQGRINLMDMSLAGLRPLIFCKHLVSLTLRGLNSLLRSQADWDGLADIIGGLTGLCSLRLNASPQDPGVLGTHLILYRAF